MRDWDNIYRTRGIVQKPVLWTVAQCVPVLRALGCKNVLDLCCGTGRHSLFLAAEGFNVSACDKSPEATRITSARLREAGWEIETATCDMSEISFPDATFDAVLCVWSIGHGHKDHVEKTISEMSRVLKAGGILVADFPSVDDPNFGRGTQIAPNTFLHPHLDHPDVPHFYLDKTQLESMLRPRFSDCNVEPIEYDDAKYSSVLKAFWVQARKSNSQKNA